MLKLNMKPTGWFQIGWSGEIAPCQAVPLRYFSHDLVAFRSADGRLSVLDAHCKHLGAHLGHGGKVRGDCIICPYHGWAWHEDGSNANIPYQDKPTGAKLRKWSAIERHGLIFLWHDPSGEGPRDGWELPDLFADFPEGVANEADYYPCYPQAVVDRPGEHIHPQLMMENTADSVHFVFTHGAPEYPQLTDCRIEGNRLRSTMAFKSPKTGEFALFNSEGVNVVASHAADRTRDGADLVGYPPALGKDRAWAAENGYTVSERGRVPASVLDAYDAAH